MINEERALRANLRDTFDKQCEADWKGRNIVDARETCQARDPCWEQTQRTHIADVLTVRLCAKHRQLVRLALGATAERGQKGIRV